MKSEFVQGLKTLSQREDIGQDIKIELVQFYADAASRNGHQLDLCIQSLRQFFFEKDETMAYHNVGERREMISLGFQIQKIMNIIKSFTNINQQSEYTKPKINILNEILIMALEGLEFTTKSLNFDYSTLKATILDTLLFFNEADTFRRVALEIFHLLKQQLIEPSYNFVITKTLLKRIIILKERKDSIGELGNQVMLLLKRVMKQQFPSGDLELCMIKFRSQIQNSLHTSQPHNVLIYGIQKLEQFQALNPISNLYTCLLAEFSLIIEKNYIAFAEIQYNLKLENNETIAELLWEQLITGPSLICPQIRLYWMKIFRTIYFHWAPISTKVNKKYSKISSEIPAAEFMEQFQCDPIWFQRQTYQKTENHHKKKINSIKFQYLSFKHKKRTIKSTNTNEIDVKHFVSVLIRENQKKELSVRELANLFIDNILRTEKTIQMIEMIPQKSQEELIQSYLNNFPRYSNKFGSHGSNDSHSTLIYDLTHLVDHSNLQNLKQNLPQQKESIKYHIKAYLSKFHEYLLMDDEIISQFNHLIDAFLDEIEKELNKFRENTGQSVIYGVQ